MSEIVLECRSLTKRFGAVRALDGVDFELHRGEVRALLGKNGAGKSTLVNLISGSLQPDGGTISLEGRPASWSGPAAAQAGGIAVVHQEFSLVPGLSVAENITLGRWPRRGGFVDAKAVRELAGTALRRLGVVVPLDVEVGSLPLADQQIVEIAKALVDDPRVLILDEPTSALNAREVESLLQLVRRLAAAGMSVIYVSHRMKEIPLVADTLTVLRDGKLIATEIVADVSSARVAELISGESSDHAAFVKRDRTAEAVVLAVTGVSVPGRLDDVSFRLHEGEVLGIAGLLGSGRTELLETVFGLRDDATGEVAIAGTPYPRRRPKRMLDLGVAFISEDRKGSGIVPQLGVGENMLLSARGRVLPKFWLRLRQEAEIVAKTMSSMSVRASSPEQPIGTLSGGNQQKGVIGRALAADMRILLLDEPTRGVDLHAKAQIYGLIRELADRGVSSIFISSELEEIAEVCDRVLVLRDGRIHEQLMGDEATAERVLALAMQQEADRD
ncbi:sugar ABC transporter ATP-binding protein [Agromyces sp. NPDC056965]|uniref:sugar ABC transporter ATP-binding protein n=1 Tax=Agromyces sp. NPDC056965 TaxID=3345983 RepID=UPI003645703C